MKLEAPDPVTIPLGADAIVPARWRPHPTWQETRGLVEQLVGQPIRGLVMDRTLVNTDGPVVAVRVIHVSTEPHTTGWGTKVADY